MQAMPPLSMSATIAGYDWAVGKYAWNFGLCQWVICEQIYFIYYFIVFFVSVFILIHFDRFLFSLFLLNETLNINV